MCVRIIVRVLTIGTSNGKDRCAIIQQRVMYPNVLCRAPSVRFGDAMQCSVHTKAVHEAIELALQREGWGIRGRGLPSGAAATSLARKACPGLSEGKGGHFLRHCFGRELRARQTSRTATREHVQELMLSRCPEADLCTFKSGSPCFCYWIPRKVPIILRKSYAQEALCATSDVRSALGPARSLAYHARARRKSVSELRLRLQARAPTQHRMRSQCRVP